MREKRNLRKSMRKMLATSVAVVSALSLAACGGKEDQGADNPVTKEWVYVPTYLTLEDENASYYNMQQVGDNLYYVSYGYDEETMQSYQDLCKYSMTDGSVEKRRLNWGKEENGEAQDSGWNMQSFAVAEDGGIVANLYCYRKDEQGNYIESQSLSKMDAEGNVIFATDITKVLEEDPENSYVNGIVLDKADRIYLYGGSKIWLYESDGTYRGNMSTGGGMGGWINAAGCGKDGQVYINGYGISGAEGSAIAAVDFDTMKLGEVHKNFPDGNSSTLVVGVEQEFLASDGDALYEYDFDTQTKTELFQWLDCDINGSYVQSYGTMADGRIFAVVNDWESNDNGIAVMTKTKAEEVVQKETIVMGCLYSDSETKAAAVRFNKSNDKYRVTIRTYIDYDNYSETAYQDGYNRMLSDISSNNCPDIISLSGLNVKQLSAKGVFEDLNTYLDKSTVLKKEDFVQSVINAYTINDKLISIPSSFEMQTIVGSTEQLGAEAGWTLDEMIAFAEQYPEAEVFDSVTKESMLYMFLQFNEDTFIDWNTGECKFNNDAFKKLLQFVKRFPDDYNYAEDAPSTPTRIQNGEVLLDMAYIYNWEGIQIYWEMFGGDVTCIGYPTADGSAGTALLSSGAYAIAAKSEKKDGAWKFIEGYLSRESSDFWMGFPTQIDQLNAMKDEATKVEYVLDENGDIMLDENGEPMTYGGGGGIGYQDGWEYTYTIPTQKEVDIILALMEDAVPVSYSADDWISIIQEEAAAFFAEQKSVDEVANIIQGRIQIYVDVNR